MNIKVILFDLGNVVIPVTVDKTFQYWSGVSGIPAGVIREKMDFDKGPYLAFEKGKISPGKFRRIVCGVLGYSFSRKDFDKGWNLMLEDTRPETVPLLRGLSGKYRLAALSNTNIIHERFFLKKYPLVFSRFERIFLSHRIGGRKPDEAVFRKALRYFRVDPGEMVFLDDRAEFIEAARKIGINGIHVEKPSDIGEGLKKIGVEP